MQSPLQRLYRTKLALLATVSTVAGIGLLVLAHWVSGHLYGSWVLNLPIGDVGSALFTTGLIAILFEYINQADAEERANERLRKVLKEEAPAIRDAVVDGFAFAPEALTNVSSPETLDRIITNCLTIQLGDPELAADSYTDLREQVVRSPERFYDARVSADLAPWEGDPSTGDSMFVATIRWEYRVTPTSSTMRFACVSDLDEYRELRQDLSVTDAWYFEPLAGLNGAAPEAATEQDIDALDLIHAGLTGQGFQPVEHVVDRGYTSPDSIHHAAQHWNITLLGPVRDDPRAGEHAGFTKQDFHIDWQAP
ncbi:hypothetical protein ABUW04_09400 [Streptacidiphilus sp. N1-10]|uniref:Uncharacterized protein n=1 Tax=Streptacidiphilus jeojiensis TaxID=3229225 RepID=A0ABV6XJN8_9ACTN